MKGPLAVLRQAGFSCANALEIAQINLPVAVLIWLMIIPMLLFGFESGAALATVVGVLIEVPVMLAAVGVVNRTRGWCERREGVVSYDECCPVEKGGG